MISVTPETWKPNGIGDLEPSAWEALRYRGSACVAAGPGSGKTEFLAQRAGFLLETGLCRQPQRILAISFKRDAAFNLGDRVRTRSPNHASRFVSMTFDSFTKSIVDQFGIALPGPWKAKSPYEIQFFDERMIRDFLELIARDAPLTIPGHIRNIHRKTFITNTVGSYSLGKQFVVPETATEYAVQQWWYRTYLDADPPRVDFVMINRLAELIILSSPALQRALKTTYPFVFIDEFQDTTYAQYSFLRSVFGSDVVVTGVGDNKQRIMGWAGALNDAFAEFQADFDAAPFQLQANFRSTEQLVQLQHRVARMLDPTAEIAVAQAISDIDDHPAQIWRFTNTGREAEAVAAFIARDTVESGRNYGQYALLARQKVADLEPVFTMALAEHGIPLRNDDALCGRMRLQDLLKDPLAQLLLGLLRPSALDCSAGGLPQTWIGVTSTLARLRCGDEITDHQAAQLDNALTQQIRHLRAWLNDNPCEELVVPALCELLTSALEGLAAGRMVNLVGTLDDLEVGSEAFQVRLAEMSRQSASWWEAVESYESPNAVPLLTIHRSKGLEYHTVFFLGLDNEQWWSHQRETHVSTSTFFVGLSRAAQRVIFTQCDQRGGSAKIADLYGVLDVAGVPIRSFG